MKSKKKRLSKSREVPKKTKRSSGVVKKQKLHKRIVRKFTNLPKKIKFLAILGLASIVFLVWVFWDIPLPTSIDEEDFPVSTKLFDRNGELMFEIYADRRSTPLAIEEIPENIKLATIAVEDKNFYEHFGVSPSGMIRALYKTTFENKLQGGSTLTQQLVKNSLLTPERTVSRKIREVLLTLMVEVIYSKDEILELYLNQIPYGSTAYGVGSAAELYFGKEAKDLTLAESALLAGITAAPTRFSPFGTHPELAKQRQDLVLGRMVEDGYITQKEADEAKEEELKFADINVPKAPHFSLWVRELLAEEYGDAVVEKGGLRVTTTLDLELQEFAQETVLEEVESLKTSNVGNGAALVTRPKSGEILAMIGSKDYFAEDEDGKVNIMFAHRQPGSSIKPLNYALAIEDEKLTASTPLADIPTCFSVQGQNAYCPKNYDGSFHGATQLRYALANSYNIPAVRVLAVNTLENFIDFATNLGITTFKDPSNYGLSLTLGGGEVRPYDMAVAFGVLANGGIKQPLVAYTKVEDWKGNVLFEHEGDQYEGDRVLSSEASFIISNILSDNGARSAAFGFGSFLNVSGHPEVSVKTGTTNDLRDNWTIGYTRHLLALSWVGNNDNAPMRGTVSGVSGASPIWNRIMKEALDKAEEKGYNQNDEGHGWPIEPRGVVGAQVCLGTGIRPAEGNEGCETRFEYFIEGTIPSFIEGGNRDIPIDKRTDEPISKDTPQEEIENRNKNVIFDPLGSMICLDCAFPSQPTIVVYP